MARRTLPAVGLDIRRLVVGRYNAFLHVDGGTVYVLTVRHGARKRLSKEDLSD